MGQRPGLVESAPVLAWPSFSMVPPPFAITPSCSRSRRTPEVEAAGPARVDGAKNGDDEHAQGTNGIAAERPMLHRR